MSRPLPPSSVLSAEASADLPSCPRCHGPLVEKFAPKVDKATPKDKPFFADYAEKYGMPHIEDVSVLKCRSCKRYAAHVPGIADAWRGECPNLVDVLAQDAIDGLRDKRMYHSDEFDPMWRVW